MGPPHLGVYLCKAENEIGGDQRGITLTGETFFCMLTLIMTKFTLFAKGQMVGMDSVLRRIGFSTIKLILISNC